MSDKKTQTSTVRKEHSRGRLKWVYLSMVGVIVVAGISVGLIYATQQFFGESAEQKKAKEDFSAMNLDLDANDTIIAYTEKLNADDKPGALSVYEAAFKNASSDDAKQKVAYEVWNVARERSEYEHMVVMAKDGVSVAPSLENYDRLIVSYAGAGNYPGAIEATERAIARFDELNTGSLSDEQKSSRQNYETQLAAYRSIQAGRSGAIE